MENKQLLYTKLNALRLEVDSSIVDDIKQTVDAVFNDYADLGLRLQSCRNYIEDKLKEIAVLVHSIELANEMLENANTAIENAFNAGRKQADKANGYLEMFDGDSGYYYPNKYKDFEDYKKYN
jgi:enoyl-[acyl-carrier-protein] reductase (NADH)